MSVPWQDIARAKYASHHAKLQAEQADKEREVARLAQEAALAAETLQRDEETMSQWITVWDEYLQLEPEVAEERMGWLWYLDGWLTEDIVALFYQYDRLALLEERVIALVHVMNDLCANRRPDAHELVELHAMVSRILARAGLDIPIEMMDTTEDQHVATQLYQQQLQDGTLMEAMEEMNDEAHVEHVRHRLPMGIVQLRELCRRYRLKISGLKYELIDRLRLAGHLE